MEPSESGPLRSNEGKATIDFLRVLAAIVYRYGDSGLIRILPDDLRLPRGGITRFVDDDGTLFYRYREEKTMGRCSLCDEGIDEGATEKEQVLGMHEGCISELLGS